MTFENPTMLYKVSITDGNLDYEKTLYQTIIVDELEVAQALTEGWFAHPYAARDAYNQAQTPVTSPPAKSKN